MSGNVEIDKALSEPLTRLRFRYYFSKMLYGSGTACCILGWGLLVLTVAVSPFFIVGVIFCLSIGMMLRKIRTENSRQALLWWGLCAAIQPLFCVLMIFFDVNGNGFWTAIVELVFLAIVAGPIIFALTNGKSLFGAAALTHEQLKFIYENRIAQREILPQTIPTSRVSRVYDNWVAIAGKVGSVVAGVTLIYVNIMMMYEGSKCYDIPRCAESYNYETAAHVNAVNEENRHIGDYGCASRGHERNESDEGYVHQSATSPEQTKAIMDAFDRFGDEGQSDAEIQEKHRIARRMGNAVGDFAAEALRNGECRASPEFQKQVSEELGGVIETFGRIMMGGPDGAERMQQMQDSFREYDRQVEMNRQAEQFAAELMNVLGK